jgi:hypothetical protein
MYKAELMLGLGCNASRLATDIQELRLTCESFSIVSFVCVSGNAISLA